MNTRDRNPDGALRRLLSHSLAALASAVTPGLAAAVDTAVPGAVAAVSIEVPLSAAFYADTSCLLWLDRRPSVGRTQLGADLGDRESRTLIHCDTEDGRRLTLAARGDAFEPGTRVPLLDADALAAGVDGIAAWLTLSEEGNLAPDPALETSGRADGKPSPPRGLVRGHVIVNELPPAAPAAGGVGRQSDRRVFARVDGLLAPPFVDAESARDDGADGKGAAAAGEDDAATSK